MVTTPEVLSIGSKKNYTSAGVLFSRKYRRRAKKGRHDCRCPVFVKISVKSKKSLHVCRCPVFVKISVKNKKKGLHDCRCPVFVKISVKSEKNMPSGIYFRVLMWCHQCSLQGAKFEKNEKILGKIFQFLHIVMMIKKQSN